MSQPLGGTALPLPLNQFLYPSELYNAPQDFAANETTLAPGQALAVPPGVFFVHPGKYGTIELLDPLNGVWRTHPSAYAAAGQIQRLKSDGTTLRVANLTGCPVTAVVTNAGSAYVQASTTVAANTGGSTWAAIVGGMVSVTTVSNKGGNYGIAPMVFFPPPAPAASNSNGIGGVQATGYATIASGTVSGVTMTNWGAGYQSAPVPIILPSPYDPNLSSGITAASCTAVLFGSGSIAAVICTNSGAPATPTLTIGGVGSGASASAVNITTLTGVTIINGGTAITDAYGIFTIGGVPTGNVNTNPEIELTTFLPRPAQVIMAEVGGSLASVSAIIDGGIFAATPTLFGLPSAGSVGATGASVVGIYGSANTTVMIQQAP